MPTYVKMAKDYDCGNTAAANLLAHLSDGDAAAIRDQMTGMPATIKVRLLEQADEDGEWEDGADE